MYDVRFQKINVLPPQKGLEFPGGGSEAFCKLNWNFQRERVGCGEGSTGCGYFLTLHF